MKTWIIEPRDSLIVRDGRPFGLGAGMRATSLDFPFPSTTTGGVRTRAGLDANGFFNVNSINAVKEISVAGPLLVELNKDGDICDWLLPAPSDALLMRDENDDKKADVKRLTPISVSADLTNLDNHLLPIGVVASLKGKPLDEAPRYWRWTRFKEWLSEAKDFSVELKDLGHGGPEKDSRVHAGINDSFTTGETGENNLFQTRGLEFRRILNEEKLERAKRMALAVFVDDNAQAQKINDGLAPLGGERRLVVWRENTKDAAKEIRQCPNEIKTKIIESGHCRLLLLTPAFFKRGSYPEWVLQTRQDITPKLKAIAHNRYQVVSGWDFAKVRTKNGKQVLGEPKPTRRLVPSGAVLFLELGGDEKSSGDWIDEIWFKCVSDDDPMGQQDFRKDGFGLAMLGTWDGTLLKTE